MKAPTTIGARYSLVAIILHWLIALGFMGMIGVGFYMTSLGDSDLSLKFTLYQWHKSFGITILLLTIFRLGWRATHAPPRPENSLTRMQKFAKGVHGILYVLTLVIPLVGWAMVSASPFNIPTVLFGELNWPHLPYFSNLPDKDHAESLLKLLHKTLAYGAAALVLGHIAAALRHHFILKDATLVKMMPNRAKIRTKS